ncbi:hypothetical protein [Dactylosporangium sp. NPDC005555]|uniref:hypothetical protein n=1 Tax=Dactylosporangium sp. NPDC005555 TaxID=3154889 RepID=UPI0033B11973
MTEPRDGVFLASAVRRHAEGGRIPPERLRILPTGLFVGLWIAVTLLLAALAALAAAAAAVAA